MEQSTVYYIYLITCFITGKIYIGCSINPEERWNNGKGYISNKQFYSDIVKYGWNKFHKMYLLQTTSKFKAATLEAFLIDKSNSCDYKAGYNISMFQGNNQVMYGGIPSDAYSENVAWDIISEIPRHTNLANFIKEIGLVNEDFFEDF